MDIALDTEVSLARYPTPVVCAVLATTEGAVVYQDPATVNEILYKLGPGVHLIAHNAKFDLKVLGTDLRRLRCNIMDTLIFSHLLDENGQHGLKALAPRWLDRDLEDPIVVGTKDDTNVYWRKRGQPISDKAYLPEVIRYCIEDTRAALELAPILYEVLPDHLRRWYWQWEETYLKSLCDTERLGIGLDDARRAALLDELSWELAFLKDNIYGLAGLEFNIGSSQQLGQVLFTKQFERSVRGQVGFLKSCSHRKALGSCKVEGCQGPRPKMGNLVVRHRGRGLASKRTTSTGKPGTDEVALRYHEGDELVDAVLHYRELDKLIGTYLSAFPRYTHNHRLYGNFNGTGTRTGRLSSSRPNLQNIPARGTHGKLIRSLFVPDEGKVLIVADYEALEARLLAHFTQAPYLIAAFEQGLDVHTAVAALLMDKSLEEVTKEERTISKNIQYALLYGAGIKKIAQMSMMGGRYLSIPHTRYFYNKYFESLPEVGAWRKEQLALLRMNGYVELPSGRRRHLPEIHSTDKALQGYAERQAINVMAQGTAADILKIATCTMYDDGIVPVLQVHDEVVIEAPLDSACNIRDAVVAHMSSAGTELGIKVPLTVDAKIGESWAIK